MNVEFIGIQGAHKTHSLVMALCELVTSYGFKPENCRGNVDINIPGFKFMRNLDLRQYIRSVYLDIGQHDLTEQIIVVDEIEQVLPARGFKNDEQTKLATGFWQDEKMDNVTLYTSHPGVAPTDAILRAATQISVIPSYDEDIDTVYWTIVNGNYMELFDRELHGASWFYHLYNRKARVW